MHRVLKLLPLLLLSLQAMAMPPERQQAVADFLNLRFGMFIHYNMGTYHREQWAYPFHDPRSFQPTKLDCRQWACAAKAAGMRYAVLTAKHHDGFCLWDSSVTGYDIANSRSGHTDLVREYVEAFRAEGIKIGLYFSVMDWHHGIDRGKINAENIAFMKKQLTELLTNYGEIVCVVMDGWGSKWGGPTFQELPFPVLADHIHSLQPRCLAINHSCNTSFEQSDIIHYEATHGQHCPYDNTLPSQQGPTLQPSWFWEPGYEHATLKSVKDVEDELRFSNTHYTNYLLNVAPNREGRLDDNVIARLQEIGKTVKVTSEKITSLPPRQPVNQNVKAKASSQEPGYEAQHVIDANLHTNWKFLPSDTERWVELDYGREETFNHVICGDFYCDSVRSFKIEAFVDGQWKELARGGKMGVNFHASFPNVTARKFRLTILDCKNVPLISEVTFVRY